MKKVLMLVLALSMLLTLAACGGGEAKTADLTAVYEGYADKLPEMVIVDEATMMNFYGIDTAMCNQVITAISADGLAAEEIWLIEAKDSASLKTLKELADTRLQSKADETINYLPEEYVIVEKGQVLVEGNYLALLVAEDVDSLKADFEAAVK